MDGSGARSARNAPAPREGRHALLVSFKAAETIPPPAALAALGMTASSPAARVSACEAGRAFTSPRGETRSRRFKVRPTACFSKNLLRLPTRANGIEEISMVRDSSFFILRLFAHTNPARPRQGDVIPPFLSPEKRWWPRTTRILYARSSVEPWLPSPPPSRSPRRRPSPAARFPSGTGVVRALARRVPHLPRHPRVSREIATRRAAKTPFLGSWR